MANNLFNPYNNVWDTVEDHEHAIDEAANNGTLFEPSWEIMAQRHESACRCLLRKARQLGATTDGTSVFKEAMFHYRMAKNCYDKRDEVLRNSR